jgi:muramoyltetrapeptide carboxypeptidase
MLLNLKRAGKLAHLAGLILGGFTDLQDTTIPFGSDIRQIIWDQVKEYDYPVCFGLPVGHQDINYSLMFGVTHELLVTDEGSTLKMC